MKKSGEATIAIYIRLSSEDVDLSDDKKESNSIANQRAYIYQYLERHSEFSGAKILEFCDDGYSGTNLERPAIKRMLQQVKERKIDCIIVKDMSRFGRNYIVVGDYLEQIFPFMGVRFIAINDNYDSREHKYGAAGLIDVSFRNVIYDLYSKELSEKVKTTKLQLAEKGYFLSPFAFFGYQKSPQDKHILIVDEAAAGTVRRIFELFINGFSTIEIARQFNAEGILTPLQTKRAQSVTRGWNCVDQNNNFWTSAIIRKILNDERYTGKVIYGKKMRKKIGSSQVESVERSGWTVVDGAIPAIISKETFDAAAKLFAPMRCSALKKSNRIFYRKIRCGHCRLAMTRMKAVQPYYTCRTYQQKPDIGCPHLRVSEVELEEIVLASIRTMAQFVRKAERAHGRQVRKDRQTNQQIEQEILIQENAIKMRQQEKLMAFEKLVSGMCSEADYQFKVKQVNEHIQGIELRIRELQSQKRKVSEDDAILKSSLPYTNARTLTREMVDLLIQSIYIYSDTSIEIIWKFEDEYERLVAEFGRARFVDEK